MTYQTLSVFGYKMREARKIKGWEPHEMARALGITVGEVQSIEEGRKDVSIVIAKAIAAALDLGITELL